METVEQFRDPGRVAAHTERRPPLVERDEAVARVTEALDDAAGNQGRVLLLRAPAGHGKTRLLTVAHDLAGARGFRILRSRATPLEVAFPFGSAMQMFESAWLGADGHDRNRLSEGVAWRAAEWLDGRLELSGSEDPYTLIHALFRFTRNLLAVEGPDGTVSRLALLIDDAHWADGPSLRLLAYIAQRIEALPIVMLIAVRAGHAASEPEAMRALATAPVATTLDIPALSSAGIDAVVRARLEDSDRAFVNACVRLTCGNPLLLQQLIDHVEHEGHSPTGETAEHLSRLTPRAVLDSVVTRLSSMEPDVVALARAVSIFGEEVPIAHAAAVSGVPLPQATVAADALAACHMLHPRAPLSFVHPLVEAAVRESVPPLDRGRAHRRAAKALLDGGAIEERVATQLLLAPPEGERWAVDVLRGAARRARASGTPHVALSLLHRAVAEIAPEPPGAELSAELAETAAAADLPDAVAQLRAAIDGLTDPSQRLELSVVLARTLLRHHRAAEAARTLHAALSETEATSGPLRDEFDAALIDAARYVPTLRAPARSRGEALLLRAGERPSRTQRRAIADIAFSRALAGEPAAVVRRLTEIACADVATARDAADEPTRQHLAAALVCVDELEQALELSEQLEVSTTSERALALSGARALALLERGRVGDALREAKGALLERPVGWTRNFGACAAYVVLVRGFLLAGQLERSDRALAVLENDELKSSGYLPCLLEARARVRSAQHRQNEALADAEAAGQVADALALHNPAVVPWRSTAGFALIALGQSDRARRLAADELALAERLGARRAISRARRCLALATGGEEGLALLTRATEPIDSLPERLEEIDTLIALGATLRRTNQRAAARQPLETAAEQARAGGAHALADTALTELAATGSRTRKPMAQGIDSLTASQRRVAELAAEGLTTRKMGEALYVTPKTIEYHLREIYRKLGVTSRAQLAELMRP